MGKVRRTLSILLSVAMVVTCIPQAGLTAKAAELDAAGAVESTAVENTSLTNTDNDVINEDIDVDEEVEEDQKTDAESVDSDETETPADEADTPVDDADTPAEGEEPADGEEVVDSTADPGQMTVMDVEPFGEGKKLWPTIDAKDSAKWKLTAVTPLPEADGKTYITVGQKDGYDVFISGGESFGVDADNLTGKILAFGAEPQDGYKFTSEDKSEQAKAILLGYSGGKWKANIRDSFSATYVEAKDGVPAHFEIDLGNTTNIQAADFEDETYDELRLSVWAEVKAQTKLTKEMVKLSDDVTKDDDGNYIVAWDGAEAVAPEVVVKDGDTTLTKDTDYTVTYADNNKAGTAKVTVTGKDDYTGSVEISFTIALALTSENCTVTVDPTTMTYTGEELKPTVTVKYPKTDGTALTAGTDYTVTYTDNINVGNATVIINGKGDYTGEITLASAFAITKAAKLADATGTINADTADKEEVEFDLSAFAFKAADGKVVAPVKYALSTDTDAVVDGDVLKADSTSVTEDGVLKYTLADGLTPTDDTDDATIKIIAEFDNYANSTLTVKIHAVAKTELYFNAAEDSQAYAGKAIAYDASKITQVKTDGGNEEVDEAKNKLEEVKGKFTYSYTKDGAKAEPVDVGTYIVTISLSNHEMYKANDFTATLKIDPLAVTLTPIDQSYTVGSDNKPPTTAEAKDYTVNPALCGKDTITTQPTLTYKKADNTVVSSADWKDLEVGTQLTIEASGASAGANYTITYGTGTLTVKPDKSTPIRTYNVTLHNVDHRGKTESISVPAGQLINKDVVAAKLVADSENKYEFKNWYKDEVCTKLWDFATETVQSDMDLYAVWATVVDTSSGQGAILQVRDIPVQSYTGNKIQPNVQVYDADGNELKKGKDYTIKYTNNINADATLADGETKTGGYMGRTGQDGDGKFNENLPYVTITGKGNYAGTKAEPNEIKKNFSIAKANIAEAGFTMKYTDQLVAGTKDLKPFSSLKYKKAMTLGTDYSVTIVADKTEAFSGKNESGAGIPLENNYNAPNTGKTAPVITAGYFGKFTLVVKGMDVNYKGEVRIPVTVAPDSSKLLKNAKINLGKNIKSVNFSSEYFNEVEEAIILPVANADADGKVHEIDKDGTEKEDGKTDSKDVFTVTMGKSKESLKAYKDYEISYSNNDAVGKATLTITAKEGSGYVGSVSTTFTIKGLAFKNGKKGTVEVTGLRSSYDYTGSPITPITTDETIKVVTTAKKPADENADENAVEEPLKEFVLGQDYTVKYANNLKMGKKATITFTANPKSGYTGSFKETFQIGALSLMDKNSVKVYSWSGTGEDYKELLVEQTPATDNKSATISWDPVAKYDLAGSTIQYVLRDTNGHTLKAGTDYTAKYANNKNIADKSAAKAPTLTLTGKGNYSGKLVITFAIGNGDTFCLDRTAAAVKYDPKKAADYAYQPKITVKNGTKTVKASEYEVTYENNKQADVVKYFAALEAGTSTGGLEPTATIKIKSDSKFYTRKPTTYEGTSDDWDGEWNTLGVLLPIFKEKLTAKNCTINLTANPSQYRYTGEQVRPKVVSVMFGGKDIKDTVDLEYGANIAAGKNKGTVTVTGDGLYSGSVTKKFNIDTSYIYKPVAGAKTELKTGDEGNARVTLRKPNGSELDKDENGMYTTTANSDGSAVEPTVKLELVTVAGKKTTYTELFKGDIYNVSYSNNTCAGKATATIAILNNEQYTGGPFEVEFNIVEAEAPENPDNKDLAKCDVILYQPDTTDTSDASKQLQKHTDAAVADYAITVPSIPTEGGVKPVVVVKNGETTLESSVYTVTYANNDAASVAAAGETPAKVATVTIAPATDSGFTGMKVVTFWIKVESTTSTKTNISDYVVVVKKSSDNTEINKVDDAYPVEVTTLPADDSTAALTEVTLEVKATAVATEVLSTDNYDVTWSYETKDGKTTGTATITAKGDTYDGTLTVTFSITVKSVG